MEKITPALKAPPKTNKKRGRAKNVVDQANVVLEHLDAPIVLKKATPPPKVHQEPYVAAVPVETMQEYSLNMKDQKDAIFMQRMQQLNKTTDAQVHLLPPMQSVLAYIADLQDEDQPLWFKSSQAAIVNTEKLEFPQMDVLTRTYLQDFLRQARANERPCGKPECESERQGGFRCRELLIPSLEVPIHPGWCFLCHLYKTNKRYTKRMSKQGTSQDLDMLPIHKFIVQVDIVGEYRLDRTLVGDKECVGIYGPFPHYNANYYKAAKHPLGGECWIESDQLVFRLSQTA